MLALPQSGAQQQNVRRRRRPIPPGQQRRLRIAVIARIGLGAAEFDIEPGKVDSEVNILRLVRELATELPQLAHLFSAGRRQLLQDLSLIAGVKGSCRDAGRAPTTRMSTTTAVTRHRWREGLGAPRFPVIAEIGLTLGLLVRSSIWKCRLRTGRSTLSRVPGAFGSGRSGSQT